MLISYGRRKVFCIDYRVPLCVPSMQNTFRLQCVINKLVYTSRFVRVILAQGPC